jgi:hypothetical protein
VQIKGIGYDRTHGPRSDQDNTGRGIQPTDSYDDGAVRNLTGALTDLDGHTYIDEREGAILDEMADLLSKHKLVPFFGAGISRPQLGFVAAGLARQMADQIGQMHSILLSEISDSFANTLGDVAFIGFLKEKLVLSHFDDAKVSAHRLLLSLSLNLLYTTNQDNLFELVAERYGRPYQRVVTLADLSNAIPGEPILIKFHGDPDVPSSLVFGKRSYEARIESKDHPLDIKLRADLLGKRLFFVGYSLQDENVGKLLLSVQNAFSGEMPPSYLLAYEYAPSMEELSRTYGIRIINPRQICPSAQTNEEAFERCLKALCDRTIKIQAGRGLDRLFRDDRINPRVAMEFEVEAVAKLVETGSFLDAVAGFRAVFDQTLVPISLQQVVTDIFSRLCQRADAAKDAEMAALKAALFNFRLPPQFSVQAMAAVMAACNHRPQRSGFFDDFGALLCPALPDNIRPVAAAIAITMIRDRQETITDNFRTLATSWFQGFQELDPKILDSVKATIPFAWSGTKASESPLNLPRLPIRAKGFHEIMADLTVQLPQKFKSPQE